MLASHIVGKSVPLLFLSIAHLYPASVSCWSCPRQCRQPLQGSTAPGRGGERWEREEQQLLQGSSSGKQSPGRILVVILRLFLLPALPPGQPPRLTRLLPVPHGGGQCCLRPAAPPRAPLHLWSQHRHLLLTSGRERTQQHKPLHGTEAHRQKDLKVQNNM